MCFFFFLNPKQIYTLVSCQIFAFSFSAPPSPWHTFSHFLSLCTHSDTSALASFIPNSPQNFQHLGGRRGRRTFAPCVSFAFSFNSCTAQRTSLGLLEEPKSQAWRQHRDFILQQQHRDTHSLMSTQGKDSSCMGQHLTLIATSSTFTFFLCLSLRLFLWGLQPPILSSAAQNVLLLGGALWYPKDWCW